MLTDALKRLTKHSLIYALGPAVQKAIGFVLLPFVTAWIGTRGNYGVLEMSATVIRSPVSHGIDSESAVGCAQSST